MIFRTISVDPPPATRPSTAHMAARPSVLPEARITIPDMLAESDLDTFIRLVQQAECETGPVPDRSSHATLRVEGNSDGHLHRAECARLWKSLRIACAAGDVPESYDRILEAIVQNLTDEDCRYLSLANTDQWLDAIRWAMSRQPTSAFDSLPHRGQVRQYHVGTACRRLRERGYSIPIRAFGPYLDDDTRTRIAGFIDSLIAQVGGVFAIQSLFRTMRKAEKLHDGMWLFGNLPGAAHRVPRPAIPFGWLLSIALRNIHRAPSTYRPTEAWQSAVDIATDFAASMDCQRYNPYEGISIEAPDFLYSLTESLTWRELFTQPQFPPLMLPTIRGAFSGIEWPQCTTNLADEINQMFAELDLLLARLCADDLTAIPSSHAQSEFPLLWQHTHATPGVPTTDNFDPFGAYPRDHDRFVFFENGRGIAYILPPPLVAAASCEAIFRRVWERAGRAAEHIVADTIEKSVAIACRRHTPNVSEKLRYLDGKKRLEIDIAVRDGNDIVLFEAKAKMLTNVARAGDMMKFLNDYTNSFLALLRQLVRHDRNIKRGRSPLTGPDDDLTALRVTKIAVSPLSFGPVSDHLLSNALMNAIAQRQLVSVDGDPDRFGILDRFNTAIEACMNDINEVALRPDGLVDLGRYMMRVSWFDLGQLLYCLDRGRSVLDGVSALMHLTFSTQDFWTEVASAERNGLTKRNWHPLPPRAPAPD